MTKANRTRVEKGLISGEGSWVTAGPIRSGKFLMWFYNQFLLCSNSRILHVFPIAFPSRPFSVILSRVRSCWDRVLSSRWRGTWCSHWTAPLIGSPSSSTTTRPSSSAQLSSPFTPSTFSRWTTRGYAEAKLFFKNFDHLPSTTASLLAQVWWSEMNWLLYTYLTLAGTTCLPKMSCISFTLSWEPINMARTVQITLKIPSPFPIARNPTVNSHLEGAMPCFDQEPRPLSSHYFQKISPPDRLPSWTDVRH